LDVLQEFLPIHPLADEVFVVEVILNQMIRDRKQNCIFTSRVSRQPNVAHGGGVTQARVEGDEFRTVRFGFDDALGMRIEVVPCFEMT